MQTSTKRSMTKEEISAAILFHIVAGSCEIDYSLLPSDLRKAITSYEIFYDMLSAALLKEFKVDSSEHAMVLDKVDSISRLMIKIGMQFADMDFDVYPPLSVQLN